MDLVRLSALMERSEGRPEIKVALIDGPVTVDHPDLAGAHFREIPGKLKGTCTRVDSLACSHGTFVAGIYANAGEAFARNASMTSVEVIPSPLSGTRKVMEVIFSYTNRNSDVVEKYFVRVDVTEEFPFLVTKLSPYFNR
jgi:PatG C-terminal